jgi:outer membrane immunogenic protein
MDKLRLIPVVLLALTRSMPTYAADRPLPPPPPPIDPRQLSPAPAYAPPPFCWTGFYFGANVGGVRTSGGDVTDTLFGLSLSNQTGNSAVLGGAQLGFNGQFDHFVFGIEADLDWTANRINSSSANGTDISGVGIIQLASDNSWTSIVAARVGIAFDRWLIYGKAGGAWVGNTNLLITNLTTGVSFSSLDSNSKRGGWVAGGGLEWAFTSNWSAKIEYEYIGLDAVTLIVPATSPILANHAFVVDNRNMQIIKFGVNYLFN